ncbi:MAG TPA: hypothetical protein VKZ18_21275 [Polyangia bacterium]|nr:hypothetical protein [Polyangia bacterium]
MIGCLIFGGLAAMGIARMMHYRRFCGGHHGGWHGGWHGHRHWHGWHGGPRDDWGAFDREDGAEFRSPFADADFRSLGGFGRGFGAKRFFVRRILEHVRATPAQERAIGAAFEEFRDEVKKNAGGEGRRSRKEIVDALRRSTFDGVLLGEQFARHDTILENGRKSFVGLVAKVHDALEPEQRERLADLIERGPSFGMRGGW